MYTALEIISQLFELMNEEKIGLVILHMQETFSVCEFTNCTNIYYIHTQNNWSQFLLFAINPSEHEWAFEMTLFM